MMSLCSILADNHTKEENKRGDYGMELRIESELLWKLINAVLEKTDRDLEEIHKQLDEIQKDMGIYDKSKENRVSE